jgi:hypothetical protein
VISGQGTQTEKKEDIEMTRTIFNKVMWIGKATTFVVGLALGLALTVGAASTALAGTGVGGVFNLGQLNAVDAVSKLVGSVAGPSLQIDNNSTGKGATALDLQTEAGRPPMKVSSDAKVVNLNADEVDGKSASEIGLNGLERVSAVSATNGSDSPKFATAHCPAGKMVVGTGYNVFGGKSGSHPNEQTNVVIGTLLPSSTFVAVEAYEEEPTSASWHVTAFALCVNVP